MADERMRRKEQAAKLGLMNPGAAEREKIRAGRSIYSHLEGQWVMFLGIASHYRGKVVTISLDGGRYRFVCDPIYEICNIRKQSRPEEIRLGAPRVLQEEMFSSIGPQQPEWVEE